MKSDWELMRKIALVVEDTPMGPVKRQPSVDGYSDDEVGYHVHLLVEVGLARGLDVRNVGHTHPYALLSDLTLAGHEFAELVRDETRWNGAMAEARSTGAVTLNTLRRLLTTPQPRQPLPQQSSATNLGASKDQGGVRQSQEKIPMYVIANRALLFLRDGYTGERISVKPGGGPQPVPDWVRESDTFRYAVKDGSLMEVEIKTPLLAPPTASKSVPRGPTHAGVAEGSMASLPSWNELQSEFLRYADEHSALAAVWRWMYSEATANLACALALAEGPPSNTSNVLRRMYQHPDASERPPAPTVQWTVEGDSPASQDLFRVIAARASVQLPTTPGAEPWRHWLDRMREEGYASEMPARNKSGEDLGRYPTGFEDQHIEHVFKASADFCFARSLAEMAIPNPAAIGTREPGTSDQFAATGAIEPPSSASVTSGEDGDDNNADASRKEPLPRPKLPADAVQKTFDAEKTATERLQKALDIYSPKNPDFVYQTAEINAGCWKVIEHLTTFAAAIFDAQAHEYLAHHPALVIGSDLLLAEVGREVVGRTRSHWTRWETEIDWALRTRWTFEYYRAYVEDGNRPGSEDKKLTDHFLKRLDETISDRTRFWRDAARESLSGFSKSGGAQNREADYFMSGGVSDILHKDPPLAPETSPTEIIALLALVMVRLSEAAEKIGPDICDSEICEAGGDLFESLVDELGTQVKTTDHIALFSEICEWARIEAEGIFGNYEEAVDEIRSRRFRRLKRFMEDIAAQFQKKPHTDSPAVASVFDDQRVKGPTPSFEPGEAATGATGIRNQEKLDQAAGATGAGSEAEEVVGTEDGSRRPSTQPAVCSRLAARADLTGGKSGSQPPLKEQIQDEPQVRPAGDALVEISKQRRLLRDNYKSECKQNGVTVTDVMIAEAASAKWHGRTAIQKWLKCDPRYDGESDRLIRKVFTRKHHIPAEP